MTNKQDHSGTSLTGVDGASVSVHAPELPHDASLLNRFIEAVKALTAKGYRHLDADEEVRALKVLSALAGVPGCYPEMDALYAEVAGKAVVVKGGEKNLSEMP